MTLPRLIRAALVATIKGGHRRRQRLFFGRGQLGFGVDGAVASRRHLTLSDAPTELASTVGTMLSWTNAGAEDHTVTSDDRTSFDSHGLTSNASFSFAPSVAGTFGYHCAYHPRMKGTLTVTQ
jgi:plastocyanin